MVSGPPVGVAATAAASCPLERRRCQLPACRPLSSAHSACVRRSGQCKSCGAWNTLEKVSVSTAAEAGGGSGARAAARFAAGRTVTAPASRAGRGSASSDEGSVPALGSARSARRSAWVQETEGAREFCCLGWGQLLLLAVLPARAAISTLLSAPVPPTCLQPRNGW